MKRQEPTEKSEKVKDDFLFIIDDTSEDSTETEIIFEFDFSEDR